LGGPLLASALLGGVRDVCLRGHISFWITAGAVLVFGLVAVWRFLRHHDDGWRISGFLVGFVGPFAFILVALHGAAVGCK
jgi:formate/nitrite transporter FocA (FNT family)